MVNCFMCWVTKRHVRVDGSTINAEFVLFGASCQHAMKVEMANQRSHAFPIETACKAKKTCRAKNNNNNNQTVEKLFSAEGIKSLKKMRNYSPLVNIILQDTFASLCKRSSTFYVCDPQNVTN